MKRIGIITYHRAHNYGAVLQCYALQQVLIELGYDACVIDFRQLFTERFYKLFSLRYFLSILCKPNILLHYLIDIKKRFLRRIIFRSFVDKYLLTTSACSKKIPKDFDLYLIGSDQMWGLHCTNGIEPVFFGDFDHSSSVRIIGYAISTNFSSLECIGEAKLKKYVRNFSQLSFREEVICRKVEDMTGIKGRVDVDPTLLTSASTWDALIDCKWKNERYVLIYQIRYPQEKDLLLMKAKVLAKILDCKVIDLSSMTYSLEDFVSLFKYALYVVTTSFHATAFSIIFERPLYAVKLNDGHDGRYENLLKAIGGEQMLVEQNFIPSIKNVDYSSIKCNLNRIKAYSIDYLKTLS